MKSQSKHAIAVTLIGILGLTSCNSAPTRPVMVALGDRSNASGDLSENTENGQEEEDPEIEEPEIDEPDTSETSETPVKETPVKETPKTEPPKIEPPKVEPPKTNPPTTEPTNPTIRELFTEQQFNTMLPQRIPFYTYQGFIEAAEATANFAKEGTVEQRKREIAAMLANARHESDEFRAVREYNQAVWTQYCMASPEHPCAPGQTYQGRGPIQLSWNYNYHLAGKALGVDLLNNPDLVATNPKIAFQTLMWFWMKAGEAKSCHKAMLDPNQGFAETIRLINGGLECNPARAEEKRLQVAKRIKFYKETLAAFGLQPETDDRNLDCVK